MKKKVCFIIPEISTGGAEKVLRTILTHISREQLEVQLLTLKKRNLDEFETLGKVKVQTLDLQRTRSAFYRIIPFLRTIDAQIVFIFNVNHLNLLIPVIRSFGPKGLKIVGQFLELRVDNLQDLVPAGFDLCNTQVRMTANAELDLLGEDLSGRMDLESQARACPEFCVSTVPVTRAVVLRT